MNNLEKQTSIPKVYAFLGLIATYFFFIFFNIGGQLLTNVAGFVIPGYYSLEALFSVGKSDDTQWLTVRPRDGLLQCSQLKAFTVLGRVRFLDRFRERCQRRLLVPILLHIQVCSCLVALPSHHQVCLLSHRPVLQLLIISAAVLKSSSDHLFSQSSHATSPELVLLLPTSVPRLMQLATRPCKLIGGTI